MLTKIMWCNEEQSITLSLLSLELVLFHRDSISRKERMYRGDQPLANTTHNFLVRKCLVQLTKKTVAHFLRSTDPTVSLSLLLRG